MPGQDYEEIIEGIKLCRASASIHITDPLYHNDHCYTWYYQNKNSEIYLKIKKFLSNKRAYKGN
ncbi:MAG: hypothetical protein ABIL70_05280 [candidate division WOR-3 bacterium]